MRWRFPHLLAAALLAFQSGSLVSASRHRHQPVAPVQPPGQAVTLGDSIVSLNGPWKFSPGDSPWSMNPSVSSPELLVKSPDWAQPAFNDSSWADVDLTPPPGSFDPSLGIKGFAPGWTKRGYPDLTEFAWYRLSLNITNPGQQLWLKMSDDVDDAYEVYANGQFVGQFGQFAPDGVSFYISQPASFPLPPLPPDGQLELAVRVYMNPATPFLLHSAGGMHQPPVIGLASTIHLLHDSVSDADLRSNFGNLLVAFLFLIMVPLAIWAWVLDHREIAWLWLLCALNTQILWTIVNTVAGLTMTISGGTANFWLEVIFVPLRELFWILFWWCWFGFSMRRMIPIIAASLAVAHTFARFMVLSPMVANNSLTPTELSLFNALTIVILVAQTGVMLAVLREGYQRHRDEAAVASLPIGLFVFAQFTTYLFIAADVSPYIFPFGLGISAVNVEHIVMISVIGALAAQRFLRSNVQRELSQTILERDLEQARELQQGVLVPESVHSPNFTIEVEYNAAQVVGGDFFFTVVGRDGSLCLVIGDVSGKGISAAMLVAVLVGAARARATQDFDPINMLYTLNESVSNRSGGHFATCIAAQFTPDGLLRIANAGHLPPYVDGSELDIDGSLPLGIAGQFNPTIKQFRLQQGDVITFMTDGIMEARNKHGELFGFEHTRIISKHSPADIVSEAQAFGQEDDMTVLRVTFVRAEQVVSRASLSIASARA
jgi:hypothetical protein